MPEVDRHEREEQEVRARSWYAILGMGALAAGAFVVLRWLPNNPFHTPSELPGTTRLASERLTGREAPLLAVTPGGTGSVGQGCRVSDVALVQERRGPDRRTVTETLTARAERADSRGQRFTPVGWVARALDSDSGEVGGCAVEFTWREGRSEQRARWVVSPDRQDVTADNDTARSLTEAPPRRGRR